MLSNIEKLIQLSKKRGFIFAGSEIYGGLSNAWDYGPLGVELKNNIRDLWWNHYVKKRQDIVGLDASILMNPKVWEASGHVSGFSDPLIDCKNCKTRHRADKLIEDYFQKNGIDDVADGWSEEKSLTYISDNKIVCPNCEKQDWSDIRKFNLMFKTRQGVTEDNSAEIYLRPETAQGIFVDFNQILNSSRKKIPFGVAQVGKAFRNEITPGNFIFRTREFEQMEIEYFIEPGKQDEFHKIWEEEMQSFLYSQLKINSKEDFRLRWHNENELSHYSSGTFDIEYKFPFGWSELWGCASRTDFDLNQHAKHSGKNLEYFDPFTNKKYVPFVIEPTFGLSRTVLMILCDAYKEEELEDGETRIVLKLAPKLAPFTAAVFPLVKKLSAKSTEICDELSNYFSVDFDDGGAIGKRYRKHDEIGTPFTITVDFDTTGEGDNSDPKLKNTVTVRDRDTMIQERIKIENLKDYLFDKLK